MRESANSPRMFKNNLLDHLSRSPWWTVPLLWVPVSSILFTLGWRSHPDWTILEFVCMASVGWCAWTLSEYWLHRVVFHWQPHFALGKKFHFMIHGVHHSWPNDQYRLVMPPAASILLSLLFGFTFYQLLGEILFYPFFGGYLLGYVQYEITHFSVHHIKWKNELFKKLKRHHLLHHHSSQHATRKFGVSSTFWDQIFRTY